MAKVQLPNGDETSAARNDDSNGPRRGFRCALDWLKPVQVCEQCQNIKWEPEEDTVEIEIQPGMPDGQVLFLEGEGEQSADGPPGDLKFVLHELPHPIFDRKGENLFLNVTISLQVNLNSCH